MVLVMWSKKRRRPFGEQGGTPPQRISRGSPPGTVLVLTLRSYKLISCSLLLFEKISELVLIHYILKWVRMLVSPAKVSLQSFCSIFLVLSLTPRGFSLGTVFFPSPQKPTLSHSNSIWNSRTRLNESLRTPTCFVGKTITVCISFITTNCQWKKQLEHQKENLKLFQ